MNRFRWLVATLSVLSIVAAACGGGTTDGGSGGTDGGADVELVSYDANAQGEGALSLIAWPYYTEDDIVTPFEEETGCEVTVKYGNTSDEMVNLMRQQGGSLYDGVSASGDASNRLIANGDVAAIDVSTFPGYENVLPELQAPAHNTVDGIHYGVPYEWGPNILMYRSDLYAAPDSWAFVFDDTSPAWGSLTAYDSPIYIADAALYLKSAQPDLGITDPYELTQEQFDAAVALLEQQAAGVSKYWAVYTDEIDGFEAGDMTAGTAWPINQGLIKANGNVEVASVLPSEGVTGWADTWMMSSNAPHPVCMAKWMAYTLRDEVQTSTAYVFGATPSTSTACPALEELLGEDAVLYHCGDSEFLGQVAFWKTPLPDCGDDRGDTCVDYSEWTNAWTAIRGA